MLCVVGTHALYQQLRVQGKGQVLDTRVMAAQTHGPRVLSNITTLCLHVRMWHRLFSHRKAHATHQNCIILCMRLILTTCACTYACVGALGAHDEVHDDIRRESANANVLAAAEVIK